MPDKSIANVLGNFFCRGVDNRQKAAIRGGEYPTTFAKTDNHFVGSCFDVDQGMLRWQKHPMVQVADDMGQFIAKRNEVDDITVVGERPFGIATDPKVMPVQRLADIAIKRNEMGGAKRELLFAKRDLNRRFIRPSTIRPRVSAAVV
jgi:hypothetical protein